MEELIKDVINKSIRKFVYIDDRVCLPYESSNEHSAHCEEIFNAFANENKHLRICRYEPSWTSIKYKEIFDNNDILILDWHLNGEELDENVFNIIRDAVKHKIIKYIFIYTGYGDQAFLDLMAAFNPYNKTNQQDNELVRLNDALSELEIEFNVDIFNESSLLESAYEVLINDDIEKYYDSLCKYFAIEKKELQRKLGENKFRKEDFISLVKYHYLKHSSEVNFKEFDINLSYIGKSKNIVLDATHVMVIPKEVKPKALLKKMYESLSSEPHGFFNFLNHEILYKFHEHFFSHAKEIGNIHDAIVYDKYCHEEIEEFVETVYSDIFRSVLRNNGMSLVQNVKSYFEDKERSNYTPNEDYLKRMNYFIVNNLAKEQLESISRQKVSFGDIFKVQLIENEKMSYERISKFEQMKLAKYKNKNENKVDCNFDKSTFQYKYAICITQHCDSLRPSKIDNLYTFVFSRNHLKFGNNMDENFCSFILGNNNEVEIIDWSDNKIVKPRAVYIKDKHNIRDSIVVRYGDCNLKLEFLNQQKDNFTQRLANEAFRYPMRVGVSYVNKINTPSCSC